MEFIRNKKQVFSILIDKYSFKEECITTGKMIRQQPIPAEAAECIALN